MLNPIPCTNTNMRSLSHIQITFQIYYLTITLMSKREGKKKKLIHIFKLCTLHSAQQTIFRAFGKWIWFRHAKFGFLILIWPKNAQYVVEKCCIGVDI